MIGPQLMARIEALPTSDRALIHSSVLDLLRSAMDACAETRIGERELIAVELSVNAALKDLMDKSGYVDFAVKADSELRARIAELDAA